MIKTADFGWAARIGLLATVPFLVMELVFNGANRISMIPPEYLLGITFLFAILWALRPGSSPCSVPSSPVVDPGILRSRS